MTRAPVSEEALRTVGTGQNLIPPCPGRIAILNRIQESWSFLLPLGLVGTIVALVTSLLDIVCFFKQLY